MVERRQSPDQLFTKRYEEASSIRTYSPTVCISTGRLLLKVAINTGCMVKKHISSMKELKSSVLLKPPHPWMCQMDIFWGSISVRIYMKLGYEQPSLYPALFYLIKEGQLYRVVASHIDVF